MFKIVVNKMWKFLIIFFVAVAMITIHQSYASEFDVEKYYHKLLIPDENLETVFKVTNPEDCHGSYKDGKGGEFRWVDEEKECLLFDYPEEGLKIQPYKEIFAAPFKQLKAGVSLIDIQCNEGLYPVYKNDRLRVACVSDETESELIVRGWALLQITTPASTDLEADLCQTYGGILDKDSRLCNDLQYPLWCKMIGGDITDQSCEIPKINRN